MQRDGKEKKLDLTIICSAWHKQADLQDLITQHSNLLLQSGEVIKIIYVIDNGKQLVIDHPNVECICVKSATTTAESFNIALSITRTKYVCALNLDDVYFPGSLSVICNNMDLTNASIGCCDWAIVKDKFISNGRFHSNKLLELEKFQPCKNWPPEDADYIRLGSGDGARGTLGPAPVYKTEALKSAGGYRNKFSNDVEIKIIIDFIAWSEIQKRGGKIMRFKFVGGSYFSDSENQQEHRHGDDRVKYEHKLYEQVGVY